VGAAFFLFAQGSAVSGVTTALVITAEPSAAISGTLLVPAITVELRVDGVLTPALVSITASIGSGSGTLGGTLVKSTLGGSSVTFSDLTITGTGDHSVTLSATGYDSDTTTVFTVTAPGTPLPPTTGPATGNGVKRRRGWSATR
jgi:hypothetical protein